MSDVIVIGSGIVGSALAYRLSQAGASVVIVDAGDRTPTTSTSVAWTNSNNKQPFAYHLLNVAGMGEHLALELELGDSRFFHHTGNVEWAIGTAEAQTLREKLARLRSWGYPVELLDRKDVAGIDPCLAPPGDAEAIAFFPSEGYVDAPSLAAALLDRARERGTQVRPGRTVTSIGGMRGRNRTVAFTNGETLAAKYVVCAVGRWTGALLATAGFELPMAPTRSCLALASPANPRMRTMLNSSAINVRPDGDGRVLLQNTSSDAPGGGEIPTIPPEQLDEMLLAPARRAVRGLENARILEAKLGIRAIPGDGHPVVGPVPGCEGLYVVCSHSGVTLAPFFARAVTRELVRGTADERLAPFRPERFSRLPV